MSHRWLPNTNEAGLCAAKIQDLSHHPTGWRYLFWHCIHRVWTSKTLSYGLFWDWNLSTLTIVTSHNRPESNNRLRILPLLKSWRLVNSLIRLPYVGLLITVMTPRTTSGELSTQITSDGHLQSWDPDKPGTTVMETECYVKECCWLNNNISNFTIDTPAGFSLGTLLIQTDMFAK